MHKVQWQPSPSRTGRKQNALKQIAPLMAVKYNTTQPYLFFFRPCVRFFVLQFRTRWVKLNCKLHTFLFSIMQNSRCRSAVNQIMLPTDRRRGSDGEGPLRSGSTAILLLTVRQMCEHLFTHWFPLYET